MTVELRPPRREDAEGIAAVTRGFGYRSETADDIRSWFDMPSHDLERDARVAVLDGAIVGYGDVGDQSKEGKILWGDIRAESAALPPLLDFVERRARELAGDAAKLKIWSPEGNNGWRALLQERGFLHDHHSFLMSTDLDGSLPAPEWPAGIAVRTYDRHRDEEIVYETHQETFSEERDFSRDPLDEWRQWSYRDGFDPALWFLATNGGDIAGFALCRPSRIEDTPVGWINILGVRKQFRRRGLGLALLRHAFATFRARGWLRAGLGVDADNPTGAVRLYERAGMKAEAVSVWYEKGL